MFSLNLHFIFAVLTMEIYSILHSVVQFSEFLTPGNSLTSLYAVDSGCIK